MFGIGLQAAILIFPLLGRCIFGGFDFKIPQLQFQAIFSNSQGYNSNSNPAVENQIMPFRG